MAEPNLTPQMQQQLAQLQSLNGQLQATMQQIRGMGITVSTVKSRIFYARKRLKENLQVFHAPPHAAVL